MVYLYATYSACKFLVLEDMPSMQVQDLKGQQNFLESEIDNAQLKLVDYDSLKSHVSWHVNACTTSAPRAHTPCACSVVSNIRAAIVFTKEC